MWNLLLFLQVCLSIDSLSYSLQYDPSTFMADVTLSFSTKLTSSQHLIVPRAIPSAYSTAPYDNFVQGVRAFAMDTELPVVKEPQGPRWLISCGNAILTTVSYKVDISAMEMALLDASAASRARDGYAMMLGYSVFGYLEGVDSLPLVLIVSAPADWPILLTLQPQFPLPLSSVVASAHNFYELADSQIVMGPNFHYQQLPIGAHATTALAKSAPFPFYLSLYSEDNTFDGSLVPNLLSVAMGNVVEYFGVAPMPHFALVMECVKPLSPQHMYGFSVEHTNSAVVNVAFEQGINSTSSPSLLLRFQFNLAHHLTHAWVPKRCHGEHYLPFSFEVNPVIDSIWFNEGFGQFAAMDAMANALAPSPAEDYRNFFLNNRFRSVLSQNPLFLNQTALSYLSEISSSQYSSDFRLGMNVYARGALMAQDIRTKILAATNQSKSFRDGLCCMVQWSLVEQKPFDVAQIPLFFKNATGVDVSDVVLKWMSPLSSR